MNPYSHAPLLVGLFFILLAIVTLFAKQEIFFRFSILALLSGLWQVFWALLFNTNSEDMARMIARAGHVPILLLPVAIVSLFKRYYWAGRDSNNRFLYSATALILILHLATNLIVDGVNQFEFGFYPNAGAFHWVFICFVSGCFTYLIYIFYTRDRKRKEYNLTDYILMIGACIYPASAVDFLVNYKFSFYPFGFTFLLGFLICTFAALVIQQNTEILILNSELEQRILAASEKIVLQQNELIQSSKLASIGVIAAGVAHELNNPLNFLKPTLVKLINVTGGLIRIREIYKMHHDSKNSYDEEVEAIENEIKLKKFISDKDFIFESTKSLIEKIQAISRGLNTFSRETSAADKVVISIAKVIKDVTSLIPSDLTRDQSIIVNVDLKNDFNILCNSNQIAQVILNLVKNAIDAIGCNGRVTVSTFVDETDGFGYVSVLDDGPGIPDSSKDKIFDPFFTTKDPGKGTGLGLSISREIVGSHDGKLYVVKSDSSGTEFHIKFKLA